MTMQPSVPPLSSAATQAAAERLACFYEQLTPAHLAGLAAYYAPDARFKDPFNDVRGLQAITRVLGHMFATLDQPRFVITQCMAREGEAVLVWRFHFRMRRWRAGVNQCIRGASHLCFDAQGRLTEHRDYWDAAEELYEKLPVLGSLMRWLRRNARAPRARLE